MVYIFAWFGKNYFLGNKSACKIVPKAATGKISCLELVFLKNYMLFERPQGGYVLTPKKDIMFYFCELCFYCFFPPSFCSVLHSLVLSLNMCILVQVFKLDKAAVYLY